MRNPLRRDARHERQDCNRCDVAFAPDLTRGECPICGTAVPDAGGGGVVSHEDRVTAIVLVATAANFLLLALFALLLLR